MKVFVLIRRNLITILFLLFVLFLVSFSNSNIIAARSGLSLWANNVIPSLFPFLVAVELLKNTNVIYFLSLYLDKYMRPFFNLPGCSAFPFIMGLLSGYPIGAKIVSSLYENGACTKEEAERMLPFSNNSGPLFIIGTVGISFYSNSTLGLILLVVHILSSLTLGVVTGIISRFKKNISSSVSYSMRPNSDISIAELGTILSSAIMNGIKSILMIGGFVTLFSVIIAILEKAHFLIDFANGISSLFKVNSDLIVAFVTGIIEFTNGLSKLSNIHLKNISINIALSSFLLAFGGISVTLQVLSIISKHRLSIKPYLAGKIFQAIVSVIYTLLILSIPMFNFNLY